MHPGFTRRGRQNRLWRMKLKLLLVGLPLFAIATAMKGEETHLGLQTLVQPSTLFLRDGQAVKFSLHGFVTFFNLEELFAYIDRQAEHHHRRSYKEEFIAILEIHHIEYDPRYLWD